MIIAQRAKRGATCATKCHINDILFTLHVFLQKLLKKTYSENFAFQHKFTYQLGLGATRTGLESIYVIFIAKSLNFLIKKN